MMVFCSGSVPLLSRHRIRVPLRSSVTLTVAVDVIIDVPVSVTVNWNGGSEITWPRLPGRSWVMPRDGTCHWCPAEGTVHVNVTLSPGHGLSILDRNWAPETESKEMLLFRNYTYKASVSGICWNYLLYDLLRSHLKTHKCPNCSKGYLVNT